MVSCKIFRRSVILSFVTIIFVSMFFNITVLAERDSVDSIIYIAENRVELSAICSRSNDVVNKEILVYTGNDGLLSFSNKKYNELPEDEKRKFMEEALLRTKESGLGVQIKNKTYNFIAKQDSTTSAAVKFLRSDASSDFAEAASWFKPFGSVFGVVMGFLSLFIFMFMGLSIVIDLAYMSLPLFRLWVEKEEGKKPKLVSNEAYSAVKKSESSVTENYEGYMSIYFKRRTGSIILMAIALGYLISGQIYDIVVYIIDSFAVMF